jgi:hypothetical protein
MGKVTFLPLFKIERSDDIRAIHLLLTTFVVAHVVHDLVSVILVHVTIGQVNLLQLGPVVRPSNG